MPEKASACSCCEARTNLRSLIAAGSPPAELKALVEEQVSRSLPVLHRQGCERLILSMKLHHAPEINRADDIDIVQNERLFRAVGILEEKIGGLFQSAAGVEQDLFARDFNTHAEVIVRFQILDNHVGEVMDVDDHFADSESARKRESVISSNVRPSISTSALGRLSVSGRKSRAEAGGQNHRLHLLS